MIPWAKLMKSLEFEYSNDMSLGKCSAIWDIMVSDKLLKAQI